MQPKHVFMLLASVHELAAGDDNVVQAHAVLNYVMIVYYYFICKSARSSKLTGENNFSCVLAIQSVADLEGSEPPSVLE